MPPSLWYSIPAHPLEHYGLNPVEKVVAWLGLYFVSATSTLAAHEVILVVPNLAQECHVHHMELYTIYAYTNYIW